MLHTTPAPQQSMPARTGGQGGQAILASSQHTSWHHQASEYSHQIILGDCCTCALVTLLNSIAMILLSYLNALMASNAQSES